VVIGFADLASPGLEQRVEALWGSRYFNTYSCNEVGTIASQCPTHGKLHIQAERMIVEVVRENGTSCDVGEIGRVVVTDLHNFAMPLIRYDLGDLGALGPPCRCGRGLPVLDILAGRTHDMAIDPTGRRFLAHLGQGFWAGAPQIRQRQIVQTAADRLEVRYVGDGLPAGDQARIADELGKAMGFDYRISFVRVESIPVGPSGKFVDFVGIADTTNANPG